MITRTLNVYYHCSIYSFFVAVFDDAVEVNVAFKFGTHFLMLLAFVDLLVTDLIESEKKRSDIRQNSGIFAIVVMLAIS